MWHAIGAMELNASLDYALMFQDLVTRRAHLKIQQQTTEVELVKVAQLLGAMYPLLSEKEQKQYAGLMEQIDSESAGLQNAVKLVFATRPEGEVLAPSAVRDELVRMGFDLRGYQANPLSSITTTMKRLVPAYLETVSIGEAIHYRRKPVEHPANKLKPRPPVSPGASNNLGVYLAMNDPRNNRKVSKEFKPKLGTPAPLKRSGKK